MTIPAMSAHDRFSYACAGCGNCCRGTRIQLNPYETARLARRLRVTIDFFREAWTDDGVALKHKADSSCVFLGDKGCGVYADRPLVCRLYPLGRHINESGEVRFSRAGGVPGPQGAFSDDGTVAAFVEAQGAADFVTAADGYFNWYCRATSDLDAPQLADDDFKEAEPEDLLNMDAVVDAHCGRTGQEAPDSLEGRMVLHLQILHDLLTEKDTSHAT